MRYKLTSVLQKACTKRHLDISSYINMIVKAKSIAIDLASKHVAEIFNITDTNNNGKPVMRCSRCERFAERDRGKGFLLMSTAITKAKEHIVAYCPGI